VKGARVSYQPAPDRVAARVVDDRSVGDEPSARRGRAHHSEAIAHLGGHQPEDVRDLPPLQRRQRGGERADRGRGAAEQLDLESDRETAHVDEPDVGPVPRRAVRRSESWSSLTSGHRPSRRSASRGNALAPAAPRCRVVGGAVRRGVAYPRRDAERASAFEPKSVGHHVRHGSARRALERDRRCRRRQGRAGREQLDANVAASGSGLNSSRSSATGFPAAGVVSAVTMMSGSSAGATDAMSVGSPDRLSTTEA